MGHQVFTNQKQPVVAQQVIIGRVGKVVLKKYFDRIKPLYPP